MMAQNRKDNLSLGELFGELVTEMTTLIRQEMRLAQIELSDKASRVGKNVGFLAAGGAVAYAGFLAIIAAVILFLGDYMPMWVSALIVGLVVAGIGYMLVQKGLTALKNTDLAPRQTIQSLQEDGAWAKEQV